MRAFSDALSAPSAAFGRAGNRPETGLCNSASAPLLERSARHAQWFLSAHDPINNLFLLPRHRMPATDYRAERTRAFEAWHDVCGIKLAA